MGSRIAGHSETHATAASEQRIPSQSGAVSTSLASTSSETPAYSDIIDTHYQLNALEGHPKMSSSQAKHGPWDDALELHEFHQHHRPIQPQHQPEGDRESLLPRPAASPDHIEALRAQSVHGQRQDESHDMVLLSSHASSHAPSYSDLFFDLLFAACLNTYSNAVSLEKLVDVAAFIGYFAALWWAWWSQAYFDVRYRRPSQTRPYLFRTCQLIIRAGVLGLWVAFSTTPSEFSRGSFTNFTLIYGCSRVALALDYTVVLLSDLIRWRKGQFSVHDAGFVGDIGRSERSSSPADRYGHGRKGVQSTGIAAVCRTHLITIAALVASGLLWILSRLVPHHGRLTAPLLVMWIVGILLEAAVQLVNELGRALSALEYSVLPERLVLFGLIILGEGFTGIAETLNKISPGAKVRSDVLGGAAIESGGWGSDTILQAASCVLIVILQFGGYFHRATKEVDATSVWIVVWAYIHVLLHMASALLVIGLKKILSFQNTLNAMERFFNDPTIYLPDTPPWSNLTSDQVSQPYNDGDGTSPLSTNGTLAGISAIISVIQSDEGANIPNLGEAQRMVASVVGLAGGDASAQSLVGQANATGADKALSSQFAPSLVLPFRSYFEFADNVVNPDSIDQYVVKSLFQFKYIYVASAAYLTVDIVIKMMQNARDRHLRSFRWAMVLRFVFAVVLILIQVVFTVFQGAPSSAALDGALAICAVVLLAELMAQQIVDGLRTRLDRRRPSKSDSKSRLPQTSRPPPRPMHASRSVLSLDKMGAEAIEMDSRQVHTDGHTRVDY